MTAIRLRFRLVTAAAIVVASLVVTPPLLGQTTDDLFNGAMLQSIQLTIHAHDWRR